MPVAPGLTAPGGVLTLGPDLWVADHLLGFCRIDGGVINQSTCNTSASSPGQATFDVANNKVYVPDNGAKSRGVYQLSYDPVGRVITSGRLFGSGLGGLRVTSTALQGSTLFVTSGKDGNVRKIGTGNALASWQQAFHTSDSRAAVSIAVGGDTVYLAEGGGVSTVSATATGNPPAVLVDNPSVVGPTAVAADATNLWVTEVDPLNGASQLIRWSFATGAVDLFADAGSYAGSVNLEPDATGATANVYVTDDPSNGAAIQQGRAFRYAAADGAASPLVAVPLPHSGGTAGGGGGGTTPPLVDGTQVATVYASTTSPTSPAGYVTVGDEVWVSDRSAGLCKVAAGSTTLQSCVLAGAGAGQPSIIPGTPTYAVVPTTNGVTRLTYDSVGGTFGAAQALGANQRGPLSASAVSGDGQVYVGSSANPNILKISVTNPTAKAVTWGKVSAPITGMARLGTSLLVTSTTGTSMVAGVDTCSARCVGSATPIATTSGAPTAVASNGTDVAFIAAGSTVERFDVSATGGHDATFVRTYLVGTTTAGLGKVTALTVNGTTLYAGDGARTYSAPTS